MLVIAALFFPLLIGGMAAFTIDLGHAWFADRRMQSCADAAALAGAMQLPDRDAALVAANAYAGENCGAVEASGGDGPATWDVDFRANVIRVRAHEPVKFAFAPVLGIDGTEVGAKATARLAGSGYAGPIAVRDTSVVLHEMRTFTPRLMGVNGSPSVPPAVLAEWIREGCCSMTLGTYPTLSLTLLASNTVQAALADSQDELISLPVYNAAGAVTGWIDFRLTSWTRTQVTGVFVQQGEAVALTQ